MVSDREIYIKGRKQIAYDIPGISCLDYLELYKKFTYTNQESYRLDHIAFVELEQKKLDHSEFDTFKEFYTNDWHKFVEYNIHDVRLVDRLDDKMKLLELAFTMAYDAKVNFEDVYSQVRMWDAIIYNYLEKQKIAIPPKQNSHKDAQYAGAYVKELSLACMTGWYRLTLTLYTLTSSCNTTCPLRRFCPAVAASTWTCCWIKTLTPAT